MSGSIKRRKQISKIGEGHSPGHLLFNDFYNRPGSLSATLAALVSRGRLSLGDKGKLSVRTVPVAAVSPWYHVRRSTNRQCGLWHDVYFEEFNFVHSGCLNCWKTVVITDTVPDKQKVSDLFKLRDLLKQLDMPSKCGVDVRIYTPHRYVGFVYGDSLEEARLYHGILSDHIKKHFPKGEVIVKLACTEFEHKIGSTDTWHKYIAGWNAIEDYLDYIIEAQSEENTLGLLEHTDADTFRFWIEHAHGIGDSSWKRALKYEGYKVPKDLFFKPKTYHEE